MAVLKTVPIERPAIWGGKLLKEYFHYPWFGDAVGQSWSFSGQEGASNVIEGGRYAGKTLRDLWRDEPQLFHSRFDHFPVIISLVAPMDDLSIQIHPNTEMARAEGYSTGKNEAWYFLEQPQAGNIVYGQRAKNEQQLREMVAADRWAELTDLLPVRKGDFVYLPAGILHALRKGGIVYEIQQATDVTYRFFDYHRKDAQGNKRPLHLEKAIACVDYSLSPMNAHPPMEITVLPGMELTTFIRNDSFSVSRFVVRGSQTMRFNGYQLFTAVEGSGFADELPLEIGTNFLLPAEDTVTICGDVTLMATCESDTYLLG